FCACNTLKSQAIMRVSPDISIIALLREVLWEPSQSFAGVHDVSSSLKRVLLLDQQPLELRSETISTHFACNTLAIVSARTRRIPLPWRSTRPGRSGVRASAEHGGRCL